VNRMISKVREFLTTRKQAYSNVFKGIHGERVLEDLARFCRADDTTFLPDARASAMLEGRREVWLRIQKHLNLSPDELVRVFNPKGE
jgi:hypothetical protein